MMYTPNMKFIKMHVDSQAALTALNNTKITSKLEKETVDKLNQLGQKG